MAIRIGCGSWTDPEYVGVIYPKGLPKDRYLATYATWFDRVEVNAFSHRIQSRATVAKWTEQTPAEFCFDIKLPRAFSDNPALPHEALMTRFLDSVQPLVEAKKLGAFLLSLGTKFSPKNSRLDEIDWLAGKLQPFPLAVELRHRAWVDPTNREATLKAFREKNLTWVALDLPQLDASSLPPPVDEVTTPRLAYMRLHGRNPNYLSAKTTEEKHNHRYLPEELKEIADRIRALAAKSQELHVSVNTHCEDFAPKAALALRELLGQPVRSAATSI
jgi:uncharacterized protein YecE (DUF72 family)